MQSEQAVELGQQAFMHALLIAAPILVIAILVGLLVGMLQAMTQIQDHTLSYIPKLTAILIVMCICLPWIFEKLTEYSTQLFTSIPQMIFGG
jgi:flagellar biosynthetic protein FliQ